MLTFLSRPEPIRTDLAGLLAADYEYKRRLATIAIRSLSEQTWPSA
jgi:hypothetical protein